MKAKNRADEQLSDNIGEQGIIYKQLKHEIAERKSTEEALKKSEERYKRIIESITDYTYSVRIEDAKAFETTHCTACFAVTGYTSEEFAADPYLWIKMVVEEDHDLVRQQARDVLEGLFPQSVEHRIIRKDGVVRWVESSLSPDYDLHGNLISYDGIVRDITERKSIEIALRESEERFRRLSKATLEGILIHDKGKIIDMNQAFSGIFGYEPAELIKMNALQLIAPDSREEVLEHISSKYEKSYETVGLRKNGSTFPLIIQAKMIKHEGREVRVAACRDITERKKSEKTLRFLSLVTEQISDSVITSNLDYEITYANQSFQRLYGYSADEILGKSPDILNAEADSEQIQDDIYKAVSSGGIWRGELINRKKDGSMFHCGLLVFPLHDKHGNIFAFAGIQRDITERKKAEQERERLNAELASKNRELEQVLYATSHDLRTPLVNIDGFSKELRNSMNDLFSVLQRDDVPSDIKEKISLIVDEDIPEALKYISLSISKMDSLLAGLLKLSRLGRVELKIEELNINEILSDVSSLFMSLIKKTGAKLEISDLPRCRGDEKQVSQIFSNLIDNAIKYLGPERPGIIMISGNLENGQSVYCVEDNGIGIDPQYQGNIFDIFKQLEPSKSSGEGLGLTIVRKSVEMHNGNIWMDSEPGRGSKFFVSLPAAFMQYAG
jgi:PAS domain S-box-containing protein